MKKAKLLALFLALALVVGVLAGCGDGSSSTSSAADASSQESTAGDNGDLYISVIAKGFQHQFWQVVKQGSEDAAADLGVEVYFNGPKSESDISGQIDMINAELAKNPDAMALAALDTDSVLSQLTEAQEKNIPVVGFDSGVPNAPEGQIKATAATDNEAAAALGAEKMFENLKDTLAAATVDSPAVIKVLSQDSTSASIIGRTTGFAEKFYELSEAAGYAASITGGLAAINKENADAVVQIDVVIATSPETTDVTNAAVSLLNANNVKGVFCSNEGAVAGLLAAINSGSSIPEGAVVVGFDAGEAQKAAVKAGTITGAITQDPYQIGYKAVELAVKAAKGEAVSDTDTGAKWYDASNIDSDEIKDLVYD